MRYNRTPKYVQIATAIEHDIFRQRLSPGAPLPTEQQFCERFQCSRGTVRQAIDILEKGGLIDRRQGSGMFVGRRSMPMSMSTTDYFIATIVSNVTTAEHARMVQTIGTAVLERGYFPLFGVTNDDPEIEQQFIDRIRRLKVMGVLKFATNIELEDQTRAQLRQYGLPYVIMNDFWTDSRQDVEVAYDERAAVAMAVEHLVELGHERLVLLDSVVDPRDRAIDEFFKRLTRHNLPRDDKHLLLYDLAYPVPPIDALFAEDGLRPTAFVTVFDVIASQLMAKLAQMGLRVPHDVSVANINDVPLDKPMGLDLTTAVPPRKRMVDQALLALLDGRGEGHVQHYIFKPDFHIGETTGPCPAEAARRAEEPAERTSAKVLERV